MSVDHPLYLTSPTSSSMKTLENTNDDADGPDQHMKEISKGNTRVVRCTA